MNCKPGDLAVRIAAPEKANVRVGCVVVVLGLIDTPAFCTATKRIFDGGTVWLVEMNGKRVAPDGYPFGVPDVDLRPIRDNEGEDETLQWAPVPVKELA